MWLLTSRNAPIPLVKWSTFIGSQYLSSMTSVNFEIWIERRPLLPYQCINRSLEGGPSICDLRLLRKIKRPWCIMCAFMLCIHNALHCRAVVFNHKRVLLSEIHLLLLIKKLINPNISDQKLWLYSIFKRGHKEVLCTIFVLHRGIVI